MATVSLITSAGAAIAAANVSWGGSGNPLSRVPWIPKAGTPLLLVGADGQMTNQLNPAWDRAIRWVFEEALGGINAPTISQLNNSVTQTQTQVVAVGLQATSAQATANGAAVSVNTAREVLVNNGTPGAEQIPPARQSGGLEP